MFFDVFLADTDFKNQFDKIAQGTGNFSLGEAASFSESEHKAQDF